MHTKFGNWLLAGALAALMVPTPQAEAQRDAGAKIRGDFSRYSDRSAGPAQRAVSPQPIYPTQPRAMAVQPQPVTDAFPAVDPYAAHSLQPLPFGVGDDVKVVSDTRLMRGRRVLGSVEAGQQLRVLKIRGPWVGVAAEVDGREIGGWLWYSQLATADTER